MTQASSLLRASFVVIFFSFLNKITGYFKLVLATAAFGTGGEADALAAASQIPDVFFVLVAGGAFGSAIIPVYSNLLFKKGKEDRIRFVGTLLNLVLVVSGILSILVVIYAPWIARTILVPNFDPDLQILTGQLMRVSMLSIFVFGLTSIFTNLLHAHKHFLLPAIGGVLLDIGSIIGLYFWADRIGVFAMAWGGFLGVVLYLLVQWPAARQFGVRFAAAFDLSDRSVREVLTLLWPRLVVLGAAEIADVVNVNLASGLSEGAVSSYFFAVLLINMPVNLFGISFLVTFFPTLSDNYNENDPNRLHHSVMKGVLYTYYWIIPSFVGLVALGRPGIAFILERGAFGEDSTALVYSLVVVAALGAVAQAATLLVETLYFARHNTVVPMWFSIGGMTITILFSILLIGSYGIQGVASARSIAAVLVLLAMIALYQRQFGGLDLNTLGTGVVRIVLASLGMIAVIRGVGLVVADPFLYVLCAIPAGGALYIVVHYLLGGRELVEFYDGVLGKRA